MYLDICVYMYIHKDVGIGVCRLWDEAPAGVGAS